MDKRHYSPLPMGLSPVLVPRFCHLASLPLACRRAALALASLVLLTGMGLVATTARGWADTLMLRDGVTIAGQKVSGASLQGDVVGIDDQYVILRNSQGQAQRVPKAQIDTIRFGSRIDPLASPTNSGWTPPISHESPSILSPTDTTTEPDNSFALWRFPDNNGKFNKDIFGVLATFKGESTGNLYAGLYNFDDKGTFWVRLPKQNAPKASQMRFTLYGKHYPQQRLEPFTVKAQFFNSGGTRIGESAQVRFSDSSGGTSSPTEWFYLLNGISGLTSPQSVQWQLPPGTQSVEFRVTAPTDSRRHLVGYLGNLSLQ